MALVGARFDYQMRSVLVPQTCMRINLLSQSLLFRPGDSPARLFRPADLFTPV